MSVKDTEFKNYKSVDFSVWTQLAEDAGAIWIRDRLSNIDGNGDSFTTGAADNADVKEITAKYSDKGFWFVQLGGSGVGGNAVARFGDNQAAAEAFAEQMDSLREAGILDDVLMDGVGLPGGGGLDTDGSGWISLAAFIGNEDTDPLVNLGRTDNPDDPSMADTLMLVREQVNSVNPDDPRYDGETDDVVQFDNGNWVVGFSGDGVKGNATAQFDNEADALAFKALADLALTTDDGTNLLFGL